MEPWATNLYVNCKKNEYINQEQSKTSYDLSSKIKNIGEPIVNDITVEFDGTLFNKDRYEFLTSHLPNVLKDSGELGEMEYDIFKLHIKSLKTYENDLIKVIN